MKLYNTLTRKKEEFIPIEKGIVKLYSCGPTVYNYVHLGNLRAYLSVDLLKRYLKYKGFKVIHVMNITDIDDKTIRDSQKEGKTLKEFTEFYTDRFIENIKSLNIEMPDEMPLATEHIKEMIDIIIKLKEKGIAYESGGSWYYRISEFKDYGKLAKLDMVKLRDKTSCMLNDSDEYEKENIRDFCLWKKYDPKTDGDVYWDTELGKGRPGWHIECSAMSMKYLGKTFDIHTGGVDLIFPHHTNEIAQSEGANSVKFVNYWFHNAHLIVNSEKMSKSLGNFYTLKDLSDKGYDNSAVRYELMSTHYRSQLDFREDNLKKIPETLKKFYDFLDRIDEIENTAPNKDIKEKIDKLMQEAVFSFEKSMDDDLNISGSLAAVFEFMTEINKITNEMDKEDAKAVKEIMTTFDSVLGVMEHQKADIPKEIIKKAEEREKARQEKDFNTADKIRDELKQSGYIIEDTSKGPRVKKI